MEGIEKEAIKKVEAALFIAAKALSIADIVRVTGLNPITVKQAIEKLKEKYANDSAITIVGLEQKYKMDIKPEFNDIALRLASGKSEFSRAEQETLAIIAYKQPIKQSIVVKIRGNKAYDHIKKFIEYGLVKAKKCGHTLELSLADKFYEYFSLTKNQSISQNIQKEINA